MEHGILHRGSRFPTTQTSPTAKDGMVLTSHVATHGVAPLRDILQITPCPFRTAAAIAELPTYEQLPSHRRQSSVPTWSRFPSTFHLAVTPPAVRPTCLTPRKPPYKHLHWRPPAPLSSSSLPSLSSSPSPPFWLPCVSPAALHPCCSI
jgi:hypothetical protein